MSLLKISLPWTAALGAAGVAAPVSADGGLEPAAPATGAIPVALENDSVVPPSCQEPSSCCRTVSPIFNGIVIFLSGDWSVTPDGVTSATMKPAMLLLSDA